jgi:excisionase family DNA binding protein
MNEQKAPLDPEEVAIRLGVSRDTIYRLMREHKIAYSQVAKRKRVITEEQLEAYIDAQSVPAESAAS